MMFPNKPRAKGGKGGQGELGQRGIRLGTELWYLKGSVVKISVDQKWWC